MTDFLNDLSYLVVVFQSYCYFECFCVVNFDLFACFDRMIYLVLCTFVIFFYCLASFICIQQYCVRIFGNSYTIFFNDGLPLKFGFFSYIFRILVTFWDKSLSELCIFFICVVVV